MRNKNKTLSFVFPTVIFFSLYTLFIGRIPHWGAAIYLSLLLNVLFFVFYSSRFLSNKIFLFFFMYLLVVGINFISGDKYWSRSSYNTFTSLLMMLNCLLAIDYFLFNNQRLFENRLFLMVSLYLILTAISTGVLSITNPQIVRFAYEENNHNYNTTILNELFRFGMSNYSLPHAIPVIIPAFVLCIKNKRQRNNQRWVGAIGILVCFVIIFYSGATTPLLLGLIAFFSSFVLTLNRRANIIRLLFIGVLCIPLLSQDLVISSVRTLENAVGEDNYFYKRLVDVENSVEGKFMAGDVGYRHEEYQQSWDAFLQNPLLGTNGEVGGHSVMLDCLATLGLLGFIPYVILLLSVFLWIKKQFPPHIVPYYTVGFFIGVLMLCLKSMNNMEMWFFLFCFLPLLINRYDQIDSVRIIKIKKIVR